MNCAIFLTVLYYALLSFTLNPFLSHLNPLLNPF